MIFHVCNFACTLNACVMITTRGQRHIGDRTFVREFVVEKVTGWVKEMENLASITRVQPLAAHIVYTNGLMHR